MEKSIFAGVEAIPEKKYPNGVGFEKYKQGIERILKEDDWENGIGYRR